MTKKALTTYEGNLYPYVQLWQCANTMYEQAVKQEEGSFYFNMASLFFSYNTLEGYINSLGEEIMPDLWKDEKNISFTINDTKFGGINAKICKIFKELELSLPENNKEPFLSLQKLKTLRDFLAHSKTDRIPYNYTEIHSLSEDPPIYENFTLSQIITKEFSKHTLNTIEDFIIKLHDKASHLIEDEFFKSSCLNRMSIVIRSTTVNK